MEVMKPTILRGLVYLATLAFGALFTYAAANGFGVYDEVAGTWTITVDVKVAAAAAAGLIGTPALAFVALIGKWKT